MAAVQKSCEPLDKELEEAGKGADEEGAEASKAAVEGAPMMEAAGKAGPSQAPVSAPKGEMKLWDPLDSLT